jgi:hypothetical protein
MFSRMPKWMSSHKNRKAVLACIDRLEKQFASLPGSSLMAVLEAKPKSMSCRLNAKEAR